MKTFSSDYSILNYVHSLPVIASENEEEFDFSISNDVAGVQKSNNLDILEIISYLRGDPFTLIDLDIIVNSNMIECTNSKSFEEGENCASTISVKHTLGYDMKLFGSDMILFDYIFKFQELPFMLVVVLINFGVKNQVPQVSFKLVARDLICFYSYEFSDIIFV